MLKIPIFIGIFVERGHHFHWAENNRCPIGKRNPFWAYQRYSHSLSGGGIKIGLAVSSLVDQKRNGKKGVSFPLTVQSIPPKKGAAVRPLNCRVKNAVNQPNVENIRFNPYFCRAGTPFSLSWKWPLSDWQKEPVLGLSEIQSFLVWRGDQNWIGIFAFSGSKRNWRKQKITRIPLQPQNSPSVLHDRVTPLTPLSFASQ